MTRLLSQDAHSRPPGGWVGRVTRDQKTYKSGCYGGSQRERPTLWGAVGGLEDAT